MEIKLTEEQTKEAVSNYVIGLLFDATKWEIKSMEFYSYLGGGVDIKLEEKEAYNGE